MISPFRFFRRNSVSTRLSEDRQVQLRLGVLEDRRGRRLNRRAVFANSPVRAVA